MNHRPTLCLLLSFLTLTGLGLVQAETALEISMKHMGKALKQLSLDLQQPQDANKSDYLALANTLKTEAQTSRGLTPKKVATLPADQQAAMVQAYQKSIDDLTQTIDLLTQALQNDQWDQARADVAQIRKQETEGHKTFRLKK
jgi:cytochrome c556